MLYDTSSLIFLSTLSLRRATWYHISKNAAMGFLSTLSLRRATLLDWDAIGYTPFLSTLSLRRATRLGLLGWLRTLISIHALLAESDGNLLWYNQLASISIHALLAESDDTTLFFGRFAHYFYPRSPCGERLRSRSRRSPIPDFYPRSPCGERHVAQQVFSAGVQISIHALLAESDVDPCEILLPID